MKERLVNYLACPACRGNLILRSEVRDQQDIVGGSLQCYCGTEYPIREGIPRFGAAPSSGAVSDGQRQVGELFGNKWSREPSWGLDGSTGKFFRQWMLEKYGWGTDESYRSALSGRSMILDAGTGLGRELRNLSDATPSADVIGLEISSAVYLANKNVGCLPKVHLVQGDILSPPFPPGSFDFILSEGVLHHTVDTRQALFSLVRCLATGGEIAFYVYRRKGPLRELADDSIRSQVSSLSPDDAWEAVKPLTQLGKALHELSGVVEIPGDIPALGILAGKYDIQRLFYEHIVKSFWNSEFTFEENNLVNLDWYHPIYAHRHTQEEVRQ